MEFRVSFFFEYFTACIMEENPNFRTYFMEVDFMLRKTQKAFEEYLKAVNKAYETFREDTFEEWKYYDEDAQTALKTIFARTMLLEGTLERFKED